MKLSRKYVIVPIATAIAALMVAISLWLYPEWSRNTTSIIALVLVSIVGIFSVVASLKDVIELISNRDKAVETQLAPKKVTEKENVALEYRIAVLEGTIEWLLSNGLFVKSIEPTDMKEIQTKALEGVRRKYPEAKIELDGERE